MRVVFKGRVLAIAVAVAVAIVVTLIAAFRQPIAAYTIPKIVGSVTGTSVTFASMELHTTHATFKGMKVTSRRGQLIAYIPRVQMMYALRDLLPGSTHLFGLHAVFIDHPQVTIVHNPDGTYNLPSLPKGGPSARQATPLNFTLRTVGGTLQIDDYTRVHPDSRHLYVDDVNVDASVNTAGATSYHAAMNYREGSLLYPIRGVGHLDTPAHLNFQRWTAARVPLPRIVNYGVNNTNLQMQAGTLNDLDMRYFGRLAASAYLNGAKVAMTGVTAPIKNGHGQLDVYEGGVTTPGIFATIAGMPVRVTGGIADLSNPHVRFTITAHGDVAQLKKLQAKTAPLPMRGTVDASILAEGTVKQPLVLISLRSPEIAYRQMPIRSTQGLLGFDGREADIFDLSTHYSAFQLSARGRLSLQPQPNAIQMLASLRGPGDNLPFLPMFAPHVRIGGSILATANDLKHIDTHGLVTGTSPSRELAALFNVASNGTGTIGPLLIDAPQSSLQARIALEHRQNAAIAFVDARNFAIRPAAQPRLPGFTLKPIAPVTATLNGTIFADRRGSALGMIGRVDVRGARYGAIAIDRAQARFGGSAGDLRVSSLLASGPFGTLNAAGSITGTNHVALEGRYSGSLRALSHLAGNVPASGSVDAPIALVYDGGKAIAQIHDARFTNATLRGVPIAGLSATIGTSGKTMRVYAARAAVGTNGHIAATGNVGKNARLTLAASNLNMADLRGAGMPLQSGTADLGATLNGSLRAPAVRGAVLLSNAQYRRYPIAAQTAFAYSNQQLQLRDALFGLGPSYVAVDGSVGGLPIGAPMHPTYDLSAMLRGADAHDLIAMTQPKLNKQYIEGSIDADVRVRGTAASPVLNGSVSVPEGSINGLAFRNLGGTIGGNGRNVALRGGHVDVGTTAIAFDAGMSGGAIQAGVRAPSADLADFNDYFNTGDTFAGTGSIALNVKASSSSFATSGNVDLGGVRFRRIAIGTTDVDWSTRGRTVALAVDAGGSSGYAHLAGNITVPQFHSVAELATRADLNLHATANAMDLGTWLPMLGYSAPVTGRLYASVSVLGRFPDETVNLKASLDRAIAARVPIQRAQVVVAMMRGRGTVQQAVLQIPYLSAAGSGTFGLHPADPFNLTVRATSPDVGSLMQSVSGKPQKIVGTLDTTAHLTGTRTNPQISDTIAMSAIRYGKIQIPRIQGTIAATRTHVSIENLQAQMTRGSLTLAGFVPITMTPHLALDPANRPLRFTLTANNLDFSNFQDALPSGSRLAGTLAGTLAVNGTLDNPQLGGAIDLHNGYFVGPIDQNPISQVNGRIAFSGTTVALQAVRANVGGGSLSIDGTARLPDVRDIRDATFRTAIVANGAQINSPQYFRGKVDANIVASRTSPRTAPAISGSVSLPSARIPLSAFWNPKAPKGPARKLPDVALNINVRVGNDVRVQSSGVDVGAQGHVSVGGTLPNPALNGSFASTGGTIDFLRRFTIENAYVRFQPSNGIMPYVDAVATTYVPSPPTYVALRVHGLAPNNMQIAFTSDPSYERAQILALLVGIGGPGGSSVAGNFNAGNALQNLALGQINTYFAQSLLEPLSASLGNALGLQNLQLSEGFNSGFGVSAAKAFGRNLTGIYRQSLGQPMAQTFTLQARPKPSTAIALMIYSVQSPALLGFTPASTSAGLYGFNSISPTNTTAPLLGTNGFSLSYQHLMQ
jgi:autotransporter translocation and assembly factor TamB